MFALKKMCGVLFLLYTHKMNDLNRKLKKEKKRFIHINWTLGRKFKRLFNYQHEKRPQCFLWHRNCEIKQKETLKFIKIETKNCGCFSLIKLKNKKIDIFAVVTKQNGTYRLSVFCDETVPPFGPTLPNPPDFQVKWYTVDWHRCLRSAAQLVTDQQQFVSALAKGNVLLSISLYKFHIKSLFERKTYTITIE